MSLDLNSILDEARLYGSEKALCMSRSYEDYLALCEMAGKTPVRPGLYRAWEAANAERRAAAAQDD